MRKAIRTTSAIALALMLVACGLSPEERMERAEVAFAENRFSEARLDLASVLQENAENAGALLLLARTQFQLGDGEGAASSLARLERLGGQAEGHAALVAEANLLSGDYETALAQGEALQTAEGARIVALAQIGLGNVRAAQAAFEAGLAQGGEKARLQADYAIFMLQAGDSSAAERLATAARVAAPSSLDPLLASARIAQARGEMRAALGYYEQAMRRWPESRAAILGRIGVLGDLGRMEEARPLIEEFAHRIPGDPDLVYLQARLAAEDNDWSEVRDMLQPIEGRQDTRQQLLYSRAFVELDLPEQAIPRLATLLRRTPSNVEVRRLLARAQLESGDAERAFATIHPLASSARGTSQDVALFNAAARASGRSVEANRVLVDSPPAERLSNLLAAGDRALREENWRAAIDAYEELRGWTGNSNAMVLNNLAFAHSRTGNARKALEIAELAHDLAPEHPSVMDTLGWLLVESGRDRSRGLLLLERAAAAAPANAVIARHLAEARGA
ncbi:tetratricopeptide repeat protein [Erythrobacter alti]|uniref:tetratricopeptide repeat protein n=1 Tax=Erythrobacter alti TaxID=1896145 RepID=UPI0030F40771